MTDLEEKAHPAPVGRCDAFADGCECGDMKLRKAEEKLATYPEMYEQQNQRAIEERDRAEALLLGCTPERAQPMAAWYDRIEAYLKERGKL